MYCPVCGAESTQGLKFCKRCGAGLGATSPAREAVTHDPATLPMKLIVMFLVVIGFISVVGLSLPFVALSELSGKGYPYSFIGAMIMLVIGLTFGIDLALIKLLLHLIETSKPAGRAATIMRQVAGERSPAQVAAPPHKIASVTEHTTRNFEPIERAAQPPGPRGKATQ